MGLVGLKLVAFMNLIRAVLTPASVFMFKRPLFNLDWQCACCLEVTHAAIFQSIEFGSESTVA